MEIEYIRKSLINTISELEKAIKNKDRKRECECISQIEELQNQAEIEKNKEFVIHSGFVYRDID